MRNERPKKSILQQSFLQHQGLTPFTSALATGTLLTIFGVGMYGLETDHWNPIAAAVGPGINALFISHNVKGFFQSDEGLLNTSRPFLGSYRTKSEKVGAVIGSLGVASFFGAITGFQVHHGLDAMPLVNDFTKDMLTGVAALIPPVSSLRRTIVTRNLK